MFTGLIQAVGVVDSLTPTDAGARLIVDPKGWGHRVTAGESISVSGVCLTARHPTRMLDHGAPIGETEEGDARGGGARTLAFDVIGETLSRSTLGSLKAGDAVNLEHAVRGDTLMGGHFVQGHVDARGEVVAIADDPSDWRIQIRVNSESMAFMLPKGSVCIDGVSLTLASIDDGASCVEVALIPVTLDRTTLGGLREGASVNVEGDMIAKAVVETVRRMRGGAGA